VRRLASLVLVAATSAAVSYASRAQAESSLWERVKQPGLAKAEALVRIFDRKRMPREAMMRDDRQLQKFNQACALQLQMTGAEQLVHTGLQYLLADCLANADGGLQKQAHQALTRALEAAPDHPLAASALFDLGVVSEALDDSEGALAAYTTALSLETDVEVRAHLLRARAQLHMGEGRLKRAIADYRATIAESREPETRALAQWGLGVALDRNYDFPAAVPYLVEAYRSRFGNAGRRSAIDLAEGILWPLSEEHYYRALALLAEATLRKGQDGTISSLLASQLMWVRYLDDAPSDGRWVKRAREHLEAARVELDTDEQDDENLDELLLK
jgi:tetratricopeptide (TPR) repeat protein